MYVTFWWIVWFGPDRFNSFLSGSWFLAVRGAGMLCIPRETALKTLIRLKLSKRHIFLNILY